MISAPHVIEIDHIVLTDVGLAPGRAPHLRALIEAKLPRLLEHRLPAAPAAMDTVVAPLQVTGPGEGPLAAGVARGIVQAVADRGR